MIEFEQEQKTATRSTTVKVPETLEPFIQAGMKRTGKKRHAYLVSAIKHVAEKEKP